MRNLRNDVKYVESHMRSLGVTVPPTRLCFSLISSAARQQHGYVCVPFWVGLRRFCTQQDALRMLRHEYGHAYLYAFETSISAKASKVFGDFEEPYPDWSTLVYAHRMPQCPRGFVTAYAATHPLEDFAETFEWVLRHDLKPPKRMDRGYTRKVRYMVRELRE